MKISVVVIAHNEEVWIERCLASLLQQTQKPDEIILVAHNCTDKTIEIAKRFPNVKIVPFTGPRGIIYARIESMKHVTGDIILCTDGDSWAAKNWVEVMSNTLIKNDLILLGSWVKFKGTLFGYISNIFNKYRIVAHKEQKEIERWIWGPSMAFKKEHIALVIKYLEQSVEITKTLELTRNPDDYILSIYMKQYGKLGITNKTHVTQQTKEVTSAEAIQRNKENVSNGNKIAEYFISKNKI